MDYLYGHGLVIDDYLFGLILTIRIGQPLTISHLGNQHLLY
jgi:hypothetical protein